MAFHRHREQNLVVHAPTFDGDDDSLLLDDINSSRCWKCDGTGHLPAADPIRWLNSVPGDFHDLQLEDAPLLSDEHIGHLTIKDFHCHSQQRDDGNGHALRTLCIVSLLCLIFMVMEIIGGCIAGSIAVMTDAAHLFSDIIGFLVSILSIWIGQRPATSKMTFGYHRVEVLGAFISVLLVWLLAGIFCYIAINRMIYNQLNIEGDVMLICAAIGVVINIIMGAILHGKCIIGKSINHGHGHSHGSSDNINIRAAAAHVIGDFLQSIGVVVAAIIVKLYPSAAIADPICTILFSIIVVVVTFRVAKDSFVLLVAASPSDKTTLTLSRSLRGIIGVKHVHSVHLWSLAPGKDAFTVHLAVDDHCDRESILREASTLVRRELHPVACAIQVESFDHEQISSCADCQLELQ